MRTEEETVGAEEETMRATRLVLNQLNYSVSQLNQIFLHDLVAQPRQDQVEEAGLLNRVHLNRIYLNRVDNEQKKS
jgi:predicted chitinase